jgi:pimeloyl-ACP methyl ester carboxylesterase
MSYFRNAGIDFYYEVHGHGPPLIFSHGLAGSTERVQDLVTELPAELTIYDNRAHGRTAPIGDAAALTFPQMADDMARLLDHRGIEKAFVGGVSMGAGIALAFGLRHPDRAIGMILSRPAWLDTPFPSNLEFAPILADLIDQNGLERGMDLFERTECHRALAALSPEAAHSLRDVIQSADPKALIAAYRAIPASTPMEAIDRLRNVRIPALVIGTTNDPIHPIEIAETWARELPLSDFRLIPSRFDDAAEHRREFVAAVSGFLGACMDGTRGLST